MISLLCADSLVSSPLPVPFTKLLSGSIYKLSNRHNISCSDYYSGLPSISYTVFNKTDAEAVDILQSHFAERSASIGKISHQYSPVISNKKVINCKRVITIEINRFYMVSIPSFAAPVMQVGNNYNFYPELEYRTDYFDMNEFIPCCECSDA